MLEELILLGVSLLGGSVSLASFAYCVRRLWGRYKKKHGSVML